MNGYEAIAASLSDLANWSEDELASAVPPKHVAQQVAERTRQIAYAASMAARGRIAPDDLGGMLGRDGGDTLMLGRPAVKPSVRHRGRRAVQWVRRWIGREP